MMSMLIIISPAKKMVMDQDSFACRALPQFLPQTETLLSALRAMSDTQLQELWRCSDRLAQENLRRLQEMDLRQRLTPAILSYEGIQYKYMAPGVFTDQELEYLQEHLRILSGFYGLLRPFDGVAPYRLEMQARLSVEGAKDLYAFWGGQLALALANETDCVVNLASKEYSAAVQPHLPKEVRFITCTFCERAGGRLAEKGTMCKMARGEMVRYMTEQRMRDPEEMQGFDRQGYRYHPELSDKTHYVFIKEEKQHAADWR